MDQEFIAQRIKKNVSEYQRSRDPEHGRGYTQNIVSGLRKLNARDIEMTAALIGRLGGEKTGCD
jgi:hypothetical protein